MLGLSALPDRSVAASEPSADDQPEIKLPSEGTPEAQVAYEHSAGTQGVTHGSEGLDLAELLCPADGGSPRNAGSSALSQERGPEHEEAVLDHASPCQQQLGSPASQEEALSLGVQWLQSMYSGPAEEAMALPKIQDSLQDFKSLLSGLPPHTETSPSV